MSTRTSLKRGWWWTEKPPRPKHRLQPLRLQRRGELWLCGACARYSAKRFWCGCGYLGGNRRVRLHHGSALGPRIHHYPLARAMGTSPQLLWMWLNGHHAITLWRLWQIAVYTDTTVPRLLELTKGRILKNYAKRIPEARGDGSPVAAHFGLRSHQTSRTH